MFRGLGLAKLGAGAQVFGFCWRFRVFFGGVEDFRAARCSLGRWGSRVVLGFRAFELVGL